MDQMISYALNFEDVLLRRVLNDVSAGFYIDAGAFDPIDHSVTKYFYEQGWRGINIEPEPTAFQELVADRTRDVNLNVGVGARAGRLTLYTAPGAHWSAEKRLLTGYFQARPENIAERRVDILTLAEICRVHVPAGRTIDFLKIDVEGMEGAVIAGADWTRWRPRVVVVEANEPETWEPKLIEHDYLFATFDGINNYYLRAEDSHRLPAFRAPVNVSDEFLIYGYLKTIRELRMRLDPAQEPGPMSFALALRLKRMAHRHPRVARVAKTVLRRVGGFVQ